MAGIKSILVVGSDPKLCLEFEAALDGIKEVTPTCHHASDFRQAAEVLRSRRPALALVEMNADLRPLRAFAEEARKTSPETILAAVFHPAIFGADVSESAILIEAIRVGFQDFLRRPLSSVDLRQLLDRLGRAAPESPSRLGRVLSFVSNKGGVGKSTLALSVACALAHEFPERVLLVDASLQMGVCSTMLDLRPKATLTIAARQRDRLDETFLRQLAAPHDCGLHLLAAPANAVEAAEIDDNLAARLLTLARRAYDYVVVDTFPLLDRIVMAILDLSDLTYIVLESIVPTILGVDKLLALLDSMGYDRERQRVVINRYSSWLGHLGPADVAERLGRNVDHVVPYQKHLVTAANVGRPYVLSAPSWYGFGKAIRGIVAEVRAAAPHAPGMTARSQSASEGTS
jgi:pilus assembly protein CpaE